MYVYTDTCVSMYARALCKTEERTIVFVYGVVSLFPVASPFMILLLIKIILLRRLPRPSFLGGMA